MIFQQFFDPVSSTFTYLLASRKEGEALIIDPVKAQTVVRSKDRRTNEIDMPSTTVLTNYSIFRPQHGHRSRRASSAAASSSRNVVMESATCRCLRRGAPGPEPFG